MPYQILIKSSAEKELDALPKQTRGRIAQRLLMLETNPRSPGVKKLQGKETYRLRVGDYRVLYTIDDKGERVVIYSVGHRREVYR
ncbi:MAG: type II toxin-antitoxin system RelE/ParE family toxin [Planctomycetes bacterium]|nr:type II toxin-antitoxin system RelE/ParE family toxin [Planctomycetota bacterium]